MRRGFYPRLAVNGIRKNRQIYLPYLLTCIGMVMMYYIVVFLQYSPAVSYLRGAELVRTLIGFGGWIIAVFACLFLFYTNSFLIRRRKKEFGLYNVLGMGKWSIAIILFWESLFAALLSLGVGLAAGIACSKLAELGLIHLTRGTVDYDLSVSFDAIGMTLATFGVIFALLFFNALWQIRHLSAIALLSSEHAGEKPPKANWLLGILGILILGFAYYLALSIEDPISAILWFFVAVLLVIVGTYLVMIAGSVMFCRLLQKKRKYYYQPNHFVSVSSMVYRMKRNGAGLASICILATMVLVMISSTASLYFGAEDSIRARYPGEITMNFVIEDVYDLSDEKIAILKNDVLSVVRTAQITPENLCTYRHMDTVGAIYGTDVVTDLSSLDDFASGSLGGLSQFSFVPLSDYNTLMGTKETLADGEVLLYAYRTSYEKDEISFVSGGSFRVKATVDEFLQNGEVAMVALPTIVVIVPDLAADIRGVDGLGSGWTCYFDTGAPKEVQLKLYNELRDRFRGTDAYEKYGSLSAAIENRELERESFFSLNGGLFYLGIILSIVFLFAAVLIIHYKQISEGYEDRARFEIMQNVGMTRREIRASINSQLLTVFFFPLLFAACHMVFAFPIVRKLLLLFNLDNIALFAATTGICLLVFALFYTLVYRITAAAYYHIVSDTELESA